MKTIISCIFLLPFLLVGQKNKSESILSVNTPNGIIDRAAGIHKKNNLGLFFENRGKLYPRRLSQGPSGEYPIGSGRNYIYRLNPFIGIPGNVVQSRFTTNEEWEAVPGYHNTKSAKVALSDDSTTWPEIIGWPVKDAIGKPIFKSNQDSYCVYSDSNNTREILGLIIVQTGYVFTQTGLSEVIFFKYQITSHISPVLKNLFFALYIDSDVGDISGGDPPEWDDDKVGFRKDLGLVYFYDADDSSSEWPGAKPGSIGLTFISTPKTDSFKNGVTDFHYSTYDDDKDNDTVQYGIMSSAPSLYLSTDSSKYFHNKQPFNDHHFDDVKTIPDSGMDILALISSGPYTLVKGDTLTFITAIVVGPDTASVIGNTKQAHALTKANFITGAKEVSHFLPDRFFLSQNYPNPFNPTTMIDFQIPGNSHVSLKVFDVIGREVATIVNEVKESGRYSVPFNASKLSSGLYFARLQSGNGTKIKKMQLLK